MFCSFAFCIIQFGKRYYSQASLYFTHNYGDLKVSSLLTTHGASLPTEFLGGFLLYGTPPSWDMAPFQWGMHFRCSPGLYASRGYISCYLRVFVLLSQPAMGGASCILRGLQLVRGCPWTPPLYGCLWLFCMLLHYVLQFLNLPFLPAMGIAVYATYRKGSMPEIVSWLPPLYRGLQIVKHFGGGNTPLEDITIPHSPLCVFQPSLFAYNGHCCMQCLGKALHTKLFLSFLFFIEGCKLGNILEGEHSSEDVATPSGGMHTGILCIPGLRFLNPVTPCVSLLHCSLHSECFCVCNYFSAFWFFSSFAVENPLRVIFPGSLLILSDF